VTAILPEDASAIQADLDDAITLTTDAMHLSRGKANLDEVAGAIGEARAAIERAEAYVKSLQSAEEPQP
jgi:hypothetical protein